MTLKFTPLDEIPQIHARLSKTFNSGKTLSLEYRRAQLLALARLTQEHSTILLAALELDLGRHKLEANAPEISPIISTCILTANSLENWMKPEKPEVEEWRSSWDTTIYKVPKGTVLNITPWNAPFVSSMLPLAGAIAAGCTCIIKPSEHSPACSAVMADLIPRYLDSEAFAVINGAEVETSRLLELRFDHIFYTGSNRVGRVVASAAAKYVTPLTLELGGKSPVFVDSNSDLEMAARRILWGKIQNAGQVCVAPDYVLVPHGQHDSLVSAILKAYDSFWPHPKGPLDKKSELGNIITPATQARLQKLLSGTKGTVARGGKTEGKRMEPTIVKNVEIDDLLMDEEIFGPILPIVPVNDIDDAIDIIRQRSTPLVIYVFTDSEVTKDIFVQKSRSGQIILNDTVQQLAVHEIPFGGVSDSGYGSYAGKYSFDTFTHRRGYINVPPPAEPILALRYPPYTEAAYMALTAGSRATIPDI